MTCQQQMLTLHIQVYRTKLWKTRIVLLNSVMSVWKRWKNYCCLSTMTSHRCLTIWIDNFFPLFHTDFAKFKSTILVFHNLVRYTLMCSVSVCCWHVNPKFAYLANENVIKVVCNISGLCDELAIWFNEWRNRVGFFPQKCKVPQSFLLSFFIQFIFVS